MAIETAFYLKADRINGRNTGRMVSHFNGNG